MLESILLGLLLAATFGMPNVYAAKEAGSTRAAPSAAPSSKLQSPAARLYEEFQNPPRRYTIRPYWLWNGKLDGARLEQQIRMMLAQHVYGAVAFPLDGLETPYLTEAWFKAFGEGLQAAERLGFEYDFVIDYNWPDGEARDPWILDPVQSRVIRANPVFHMRSLVPLEKSVVGPQEVTLEAPEKIEFAVAVRSTGEGQIDETAATLIESGIDGRRLIWSAPEGNWKLVAFYLVLSEGDDGGQVDLMNPKALETYLRIALDPYYSRFPTAFGKNIKYLIGDHEGYYGHPIAWSPDLFRAFQEAKGYDLRPYLPLLLYDGGRLTPKVRCDYLDLVSTLYARAFCDTIRSWTEKHRTQFLSHFWESPLVREAAGAGDLMRLLRHLSLPGADTLHNTAHVPREFMEAASVAHFRGTGYWVENQCWEGADSSTDLGTMRTGTYLTGAWGATLLSPFFYYDNRKVLYPPDWFYDQPFWKYFRTYADATRRMLLMNDGGQKVANIAILQPLETVWAEMNQVHPDGYLSAPSLIPLVEQDYSYLMYLLTNHQWSYDVMDAHYLEQAQLAGTALRLGGDDYRALILPPLGTVRRSSFHKVQRFYEAGGLVIALSALPRHSMEYGKHDPELRAMVEAVFGPNVGKEPHSLNTNGAGGRAYFIPGKLGDPLDWYHGWLTDSELRAKHIPPHVETVLSILDEAIPKDFRVIEGSADNLVFNHMVRQGIHFYWIVNDSPQPQVNRVLLSVRGAVERWQPDSGERRPLFSRATPHGTEVRLRLEPGDGCYLVFDPSARRDQGKPQVELTDTNLDDFSVASQTASAIRIAAKSEARAGANYAEFVREGQRYRGEIRVPDDLKPFALLDTWQFQPAPPRVEVPYARTRVDADGTIGTGWADPGLDDSQWPQQWVSEETDSLREWWLLGPFADANHAGFFSVLPPEKGIDLEATYQGRDGPIRWQKYDSPEYAVNWDGPLQNHQERWGVIYALTHIYSPTRRQAEIRVAAPNLVAWLNGKRIMIQHTYAWVRQLRRVAGVATKVWLEPGWNSLLLKLENDRPPIGATSPAWTFAAWVTDLGSPQDSKLVCSPTKTLPDPAKLEAGYRWYRYRLPPGTVALVPPKTRRPMEIFVNGQPARVGKSGLISYTWLPDQPMVAAFCLKGPTEMYDGPRFVTGPTLFRLQSWTDTALENFSGDGVYETDFTLPAAYLKHHVRLDCGEVGVAAEVWVNGQRVGVRVWKPYALDITRLVRPGKNHLRIVVTNSEGNKRAVGVWRSNLSRLRVNGLLGPVRIVPYLDETVVCKKQ